MNLEIEQRNLASENLKYKRILLKLGGEALAGADGAGIDPSRAEALAQKLEGVLQLGAQMGLFLLSVHVIQLLHISDTVLLALGW